MACGGDGRFSTATAHEPPHHLSHEVGKIGSSGRAAVPDQSTPERVTVRLIGRGGSVKNIRVTIIPGQVTLDGESWCVVGDWDELVEELE
ncbi:hypothetical protein GCM10009748_11340 [Agromyces lapidis]